MMLEIHSEAWHDIYAGIVDDFLASTPLVSVSGREIEAHLRTLDIVVHKDSDGRWEWIDVLDPGHLSELYLRWAH